MRRCLWHKDLPDRWDRNWIEKHEYGFQDELNENRFRQVASNDRWMKIGEPDKEWQSQWNHHQWRRRP